MPRYHHPVDEFGMTFVDPEFGNLYRPRSRELPIDLLEEIAARIAQNQTQ